MSWNSVPWGRMVNKFFLQEINAHGCMRRNLRLAALEEEMIRLRLRVAELEQHSSGAATG